MTKPTITKRSVKGAALTYNELDTNFQNLADATLSITGGSTAVTSDLNGNITLVAGSNITITGDNTAKTITIAAAGTGTVNTGVSGRIAYYPNNGTTVDDTDAAIIGTNITLGKDIDMNNHKLISSSGVNIVIEPGGTADVLLNTEGLAIGDGSGVPSIYSQNGSYPGVTLNTHPSYLGSIALLGGQNGDIRITAHGTGQILLDNTLTSYVAAGKSQINSLNNVASYANGATINFSDFSGMVMINRQDSLSGNVALWLCGGGVANKLGDSQADACGTIAGNGAVNGYTWTNNTGVTINAAFFSVKTRSGG